MGEITTGDLAEFLREIDKRDQPTLPGRSGEAELGHTTSPATSSTRLSQRNRARSRTGG
jgi:hypothetical protein